MLMNDNSLLFSALLFVGGLGFVVSAILFFVNREGTPGPKLLAGLLGTLSFVIVINAAMLTRFFLEHPHVWRTYAFVPFCIGPLSYLYVRSVLERDLRLRASDLLFFLPALIYEMSLVPFLLLPSGEKRRIIQSILADPRQVILEPEGSLPPGWGSLIRLLVGMSFLGAQIWILWSDRREAGPTGNFARQNLAVYRWLVLFTAVMSMSYLIVLTETLFHLGTAMAWGLPIVLTISLTILLIVGMLLLRPETLYGLRGYAVVKREIRQENASPKRYTLTDTLADAIRERVTSLFKEEKPFLKTGYTLHDLSAQTGIPVYQLSAFINQEHGKNFNEFINDHRVDHLGHMMAAQDDLSQYTLEALGQMVGFQSRNAFIAAVKRRTGKTPSDHFGRKGS